ncbi:cardiolipin synthase [Pedobacter punctiformis]|uniref:Cardiolipin synthase n=1 Tax=Pedobacter punctiformis TaxID=3004097 RepID=A0ABT4L9K8_9SPHI|nr:cardiolipin synthase [Pedobacter sp. HCMS5-2]MCZ4243858.1 cardiolipin synthase [Pedobacter sp. HCMS5-2]
MNWLLLSEIVYAIIVILVCLRVVIDTRSNTKTLAYLLLTIFIPVLGIIIYFSVGINYRKRKMFSKKLLQNEDLAKQIEIEVNQYSQNTFNNSPEHVQVYERLSHLLLKDTRSPLTGHNAVKLLFNGENKFPEVLQALRKAEHHIHIEYYIFEDDEVGRSIEKVLIEKAKEGIEIRFIYDDFGSRSIRKKMVDRLRNAGIEAFAFSKITFIALANQLNYRNHRKIIIIDGVVGFVGGINVSDRYVNHAESKALFWRDTHLRLEGPGIYYLQYLFLCDWNFCAEEKLQPNNLFFPRHHADSKNTKVVQIAASGPDSNFPSILFSLLEVISNAKKEILITTPYFIPGESIIDALTVAALSGVSIKLLVPDISDSKLVNAAAKSYYDELLKVDVEIYLYQKGFVHAKTMVADKEIAIVGSANMDYRSFDLNFEVNAIIYDEEIAGQLSNAFYDDILNAKKIDRQAWENRPAIRQLLEKSARLISPLL